MLDKLLIEIHAIWQEHIGNSSVLLVEAVGLDGNVFPEGEVSDGVLGLLAVSLALLWAVYPVKTDAFSLLVVEDFDRVAVEDGNDGTGEISIGRGDDETETGRQEYEERSYSLP